MQVGVERADPTIDVDVVERLKDDPFALAEYVAKARDKAAAVGSPEWFGRATPKEINDALKAGELDGLLHGT